MHRTIDIAISTQAADRFVADLRTIEGVVGLSHHRGASIVPPGDRVTVHVLNRAADTVLKSLVANERYGPVSVVTAEVASIIDSEHQHAIDRDVDEAIWEELETGLRHQGRVTQNYLALMALGGLVAGAGLLALDEPALQVTAAVAAAVIAPGFEPAAKMPLGLVLMRREVLVSGLVSTLAGYAALVAAACLSYGILAVLGVAPGADEVAESAAVGHIVDPSWPDLLISASGAFAGVIIQAAFRRSVIAGALIAMRMIDAAALTGLAIALGRFDLAGEGLQRLAIDVAFIVVAGLLVFAFKQRFVHQRAPLR